MTFQYYTLSATLNMSEMFHPGRNNHIVDCTGSDEKFLKFAKAVFEHNGNQILEAFAKTSEYNRKFINLIRTNFSESEWWVLATLGEFTRLKTKLEFGTISSELTGASLSESFRKHWERQKREGIIRPDSLPTPYREYFYYVSRNWNLRHAGKNKNVAHILEMMSANETFEIKIETTQDENGNYTSIDGKIMTLVTDTNRTVLYKQFAHNANVIEIFGERNWLDKDEGDVPLYGVELECSSDYTQQQLVDAFPNAFAACLHDGTITGTKANANELVTIPASLRKHKRQWAWFFKNLNEDMFDTSAKTGNGMHVHIDRKAFQHESLHLQRFCEFFSNPSNIKFLKEISERNEQDQTMAKFVEPKWKSATKVVGFDEGGKAKTVVDHSRKIYNPMKADALYRTGDKYVAVNMSHSATLEIRIFKGIMTFASVIKNLEFCDSLVLFSKYHSFAEMNVAVYLRWLNNLPNSQYRWLRECVERLNFEKIIFETEITNQINRKTAKEFVEYLNDRTDINKEQYNFIVKSFTDKFKDKAFKLKNRDGKWELIRETTRFSDLSNKFIEKLAR